MPSRNIFSKCSMNAIMLISTILFNPSLWADRLREQAVVINAAVPDISLYDDYFTIDKPFFDLAEWDKEDIEAQQKIKEFELGLKRGLAQADEFDLREKIYQNLMQREIYLRTRAKTDFLAKYESYLKGDLKEEPNYDPTKAESQIFSANSQLRIMTANFSSYPRLDKALLTLARNLCRIGNENSQFYFKMFTERFPDSPLKLHLPLARADCAVQLGSLDQAILEYRKFLTDKAPDHVLKAYAAYRIAWVYLQKYEAYKDQDAAINLSMAERSFKGAIQYSEGDDEDRLFKIRNQAIADLAWVYAIRGEAHSAVAYFEKIGNPEAMGHYYYRYGLKSLALEKQSNALIALNNVARKYNGISIAPLAYLNLVDLYLNLKDHKSVVRILDEFSNITHEDHPWFKENEDDQETIKLYQAKIARILLSTAEFYYNESKDDSKLLANSSKLYEVYLRTITQEKQDFGTHFTLASIYFEMQEYLKSAEIFGKVHLAAKEEDPKKRDSAFNQLAAMAKHNLKAVKPKSKSGFLKEPAPIPEFQSEYIETIDQFVMKYPTDESAVTFLNAKADLYHEFGHYDEFIETLEFVASENSDGEASKIALQKILTFYSIGKQWVLMRDKILGYLENPKFLTPELQGLLNTSLNNADIQIKQGKSSGSKK